MFNLNITARKKVGMKPSQSLPFQYLWWTIISQVKDLKKEIKNGTV